MKLATFTPSTAARIETSRNFFLKLYGSYMGARFGAHVFDSERNIGPHTFDVEHILAPIL